MTARLRLLAAALALSAAGSACGGGASAGPDVCANQTLRLPQVLGGLSVGQNRKAAAKVLKEGGVNTYARDVSVFSLRQGKELRAIFEVLRFTADARPDDVEFRRKVVTGVGGATRRPEPINGQLVYKARQNSQLFYIWFQQCFLEVLIVREDATVRGQAVGVNTARLVSEALALQPTTV